MRLSECITNSLYSDGIIQVEEKEIIQFGLESLWSNLTGFVLFICVGVGFESITNALLLWLMLFFLRKNAGGYHANSAKRCILISLVMLVVVFSLYGYHAEAFIFVRISMLVSVSVIWLLAPVDDSSKILDEKEVYIYKRRTRAILIIESIIFICAIWCKQVILEKSISMACFIVFISLLMGKIKMYCTNHGKNKQKEQ